MQPEEKDLIWLPKSIVKKLKDLEGTKELEEAITSYIEESKKDLKTNIESLDDDILMYKAAMVKAKNAFQAAKEEQLSASYAMWEKYDEELGKVRMKVASLKDEIKPLKEAFQELDKEMGKISKWELKELLELIQTISNYLYSEGNTARILKFLFENYKREEVKN